MTYCTWDNLLLYLCLNGCILKVSSSRDRVGGWVWCLWCLCPSWGGRGGVWLGGGAGRGQGVNYHNWSIPRVSSSRKWTGQGLSSSKQEHFFAPKSSSKRSFFLFKVTTDGWYQNPKGFFVLLFLETKKSFFAWLSVVFLLACVPGKSMTIVWTLTYRCVWKMLRKFLHEIFYLPLDMNVHWHS